MFNLGMTEIGIIAVVAVLAIGPKELPMVMTQLGRAFRRIGYIRFAIARQFDHFIDEAGIKDAMNEVNFEAPTAVDPHASSVSELHEKALAEAKAKQPTKKKTTAKKAPSKLKTTKKAATKTAIKPKATRKSKAKDPS